MPCVTVTLKYKNTHLWQALSHTTSLHVQQLLPDSSRRLKLWWIERTTVIISHDVLTLLFLNTLRPIQNDRHFPNDIFKCIFLNENIWHSMKISLKFVPKGPNDNIPALVQIMAWRRPGDKPLSEPMMVSSLTHMRHSASMSQKIYPKIAMTRMSWRWCPECPWCG